MCNVCEKIEKTVQQTRDQYTVKLLSILCCHLRKCFYFTELRIYFKIYTQSNQVECKWQLTGETKFCQSFTFCKFYLLLINFESNIKINLDHKVTRTLKMTPGQLIPES